MRRVARDTAMHVEEHPSSPAAAPQGRPTRRLLVQVCWIAALLPGVSACAAPPAAPSRPAHDVLHGVRVDDPYRNLENVADPQTRAWLEAQGAHAAAELGRIEGRDAMARRLGELVAVGRRLCARDQPHARRPRLLPQAPQSARTSTS